MNNVFALYIFFNYYYIIHNGKNIYIQLIMRHFAFSITFFLTVS